MQLFFLLGYSFKMLFNVVKIHILEFPNSSLEFSLVLAQVHLQSGSS